MIDSDRSRWRRGARRLVTVLAVVGLGTGPLAAQEVEAVLGADTARVGDVVPVGVPITVAPGERVAWPDTLPLGRVPAENAARVTEQVDTLADGRVVRMGVYAVTPWRTGPLQLPDVSVQVVGAEGGVRARRAGIPSITVVSVLPADTAGVEPKPARGVRGPSWAWTPILLIAALLLVALLALLWWWRRRRTEDEPAVSLEPLIPPRERALAALQEARDSGLLERGELKEFYTRVSEAVRAYVAALNGGWGEDLTTTELLARFKAQVGFGVAVELREVLGPADQVKFARREPDRETALQEWEQAREWVRSFDWPPRPVSPEEEAA